MLKNKTITLALFLAGILAAIGIVSSIVNESDRSLNETNIESTTTPKAFETRKPPETNSPEKSEPQTTPEASTQEEVQSESALASPQPPSLNESDLAFLEEVAALKNGSELVSLFTQEEVIRKLVRAIYGLSQGRVVRQYRPIKSPKGSFLAKKLGQQTSEDSQELYRIDRENYSRYSNYISLFSSINNEALIVLYTFYLPVFEQAYQELGLADGSFHETLIKAINVLLATPESQVAYRLVQPSVFYKFADKKIEQLIPVQKLLIRTGPENREALYLELQEFLERLEKINP